MKKVIIIIIFTILFGGCTVNFGKTKPEKEIETEVTETQKTPPKPKLWPKGEKEFWYAKYFLSMALNPNVQAHITPKQVFEIVRCTVDGFEVDYEYKKFVDEIGDKQILPPHISKYVYDLSFNCSVKVRMEHEKAMREKIEKEAAIPLEQSI